MTTTFERAREEARSAETKSSFGVNRSGRCTVVPVSIKDTFETAGVRTVRGQPVREQCPRTRCAGVARLKRPARLCWAKTNVPEFAMDSDRRTRSRTHQQSVGSRSSPRRFERRRRTRDRLGLFAGAGWIPISAVVRVPSHFCGMSRVEPTPRTYPRSGSHTCLGRPVRAWHIQTVR